MLDCYDLGDTRRESVLFSFRESALSVLAPALAGLERASGVELDPYGTTRLYPNQLETLLELIAACPIGDPALEAEVGRLSGFLSERVRAGAGILIEGE